MMTDKKRSWGIGRTVWTGLPVLKSLIALPGLLAVSLAIPAAAAESEFAGLIRTKTPDRSSYEPPSLPARRPDDPIVTVAADPVDETASVQPVTHYSTPHRQPRHQHPQPHHPQPHHPQPLHHQEPLPALFDDGCGAELIGSCDGGCDSFCGGCDGGGTLFRHRRCFDPDRWFASVELMLMFRSGDQLPPLVQSGPADAATDTVLPVVFGGETVLDEMTVGGRVTLGTWLDRGRNVSLVARGWGAGTESFAYDLASNGETQINRPFFDSNGPRGFEIAGVVLDVPLTAGEIAVRGANRVYGGDIAIRQLWTSGLGGRVEVLYGYQHMRMSDELDIFSRTYRIPPPNPTLRDSFEADNVFHGGQLGLATRYNEGCWSFDGLIKVAGGSIRRTAERTGVSNIPPGDGLFVNAGNAGTIDDSTFGWVPELSATLGCRFTRNLDLTVGYHVIAMTDALQVSGMIDRTVNLDDGRPNDELRFGTYHVQGIHFGLQCVY